jgi:hypothetical protein
VRGFLKRLVSPLTRKRREQRKHRQIFSRMKTDESKQFLVRVNGERCFLRVEKRRATFARACQQFLWHSIFHELYPQHAIDPVAVVKGPVREQWGVASRILRHRSRDYIDWQKWFYENRFDDYAKQPDFVQRHVEFASTTATDVLRRILAESGISLNPHSVNIANVRGEPVFFEIDGVDASRLRRLPAQRREALATALRRRFESLEPEPRRVLLSHLQSLF